MHVFLDIDGVLATEDTWDAWYAAGAPPDRKHELLDSDCVAHVQRLCDHLRARVVISSSWRHGHALEELIGILRAGGLSVDVVGVTPQRDDFDRGLEIAQWVAAHGIGEDFVILEDAEDVAPYEHRTVRPWFRGDGAGFRARQYAEALRIVEASG